MLPQSPANISPAEQSEPGFTIRAAFLLWWDIQESMQRFIKSTFAVRLGADGSSCLAKRIRAVVLLCPCTNQLVDIPAGVGQVTARSNWAS